MNLDNVISEELASRPHNFANWVALKQSIHCNGDYEGARIGAYSLTTADRSVTLISSYHQWCGKPASAASVARRALNNALKMESRKRFNWNKANQRLLDLPQPLFCDPLTDSVYLIYCDIKGAYHSIYTKLPLLLYYSNYGSSSQGSNLGSILPQDIREFKLARNCVVGAMRARGSLIVRNKQIVRIPSRNPLISPSHWGFIATLLHCIAHYAISMGAVYFNTDGAIFRNRSSADKWMKFIESLGLQASIKAEGIGCVWGVGRYSIGKERMSIYPPCTPFSNLIELNEDIFDLWMKMQ